MKKEELISSLQKYENELKQLGKTIAKYAGAQIKQQPTKDEIQTLAGRWFENFEKPLAFYGVPSDTIVKYRQYFDDLIHMSIIDTRKTRYADMQSLLLN